MSEGQARGRGRLVTGVLLSTVAVGLAVLHAVRPDVTIDATTTWLLVIAAVPWLGSVFTSIITPAGELKYREEVEEKFARLAKDTRRVERIAETAEAVDLARHASTDVGNFDDLATEYERVRGSMRAGDSRTQAMTGVVGKMITAVERGATMDVAAGLRSSRQGLRLAAYVVLYTRPDPTSLIPLVESVAESDGTPFVQYWGLRALRRVVDAGGPGSLDRNTRRRLAAFAGTLGYGTDRRYELDQILESIDT